MTIDVYPLTSTLVGETSPSRKRLLFAGLIYNLRSGGHYGGVLLDTFNRTFTIYDPSYTALVSRQIIPFVVDEIERATGYEYIPIPCPMDFQHETNDYYCSLWTIMVMYQTCISDMSIDEVVERLFELSPADLEREISGFIYFLHQMMEDLNLLPESLKVSSFVQQVISDRNIDPISKQQLVQDVTFSNEPGEFIDALGLYRDYNILEYIQTVYTGISQITNDRRILEFIRSLDQPMDIRKYQEGVELLYTSKSKTREYLPISLYRVLNENFPEIERFTDLIQDISSNIKFSFDRQQLVVQTLRLEEEFMNFYGLPREGYRIWSFILEFYIRYLFLDTYDSPRGMDLMNFRARKYVNLARGYSITDGDVEKVITAILYTPIRYVDADRYFELLGYSPDNNAILNALLESSLLRSPSSNRIYSTRIQTLLESK